MAIRKKKLLKSIVIAVFFFGVIYFAASMTGGDGKKKGDESNDLVNTGNESGTLAPEVQKSSTPVTEEVGKYGLVHYSLAGPKGVLLCFHGTGGSAKGWATPGDDNQAFVASMAAAGWSYICPTSLDRTMKQWSPVNNLSNPDVKNVDALLDSLGIAQNTPLIIAGHSNGGGMASRFAIGSKRADDIVAVQFSNSGGLTQALGFKEYTFPTLFNYSLCDQTVDSAVVEESYSVLQKRGITATLNALDSTYAAGSYKSCHEFVNTGTKVLELL